MAQPAEEKVSGFLDIDEATGKQQLAMASGDTDCIDASPSDQKLVLKLFSIDDKKFVFQDLDQRAQPPIRVMPDGKGVAYTVKEKGVDSLWVQPLDSTPSHQLTHFTSDQIYTFRFSRDGSKIAFERGHTESDAVLLRDNPR